ncbi:hypothetical protein ACP4OV_007673 [Aristida adscensionis]
MTGWIDRVTGSFEEATCNADARFGGGGGGGGGGRGRGCRGPAWCYKPMQGTYPLCISLDPTTTRHEQTPCSIFSVLTSKLLGSGDRPEMPYEMAPPPRDDDPVLRGPNVVVGDRLERFFIQSGRGLVLSGALAVVSTVGDATPDGATAFLGFSGLLLGVLLLVMSPLAYKIPRAARGEW